MTISRNSIPKVTKGVLAVDLSGEFVLLNTSNGTYYGLQEVGYLVWKNVVNSKQVSEIIQAVMLDYDVETSKCQRDVIALLSELENEGLIEIT